MLVQRIHIRVLILLGLWCACAEMAAAADDAARIAADHRGDELSVDCGTAISPAGVLRASELDSLGAYRLEGGVGRHLLLAKTAVHIVRTTQGTGGLDEQQLATALEKLDSDFAAAGLAFVRIEPLDYIDSDAFYYDIDTRDEIDALRATHPVAGAMNIYFTENLADENGQFCGISSFSWQSSQGVVMMNACTVTEWNPSTFAHEVGHYFDLYHTHETAFGSECVDGSNCESAGDRLCDTPADPRLNRCDPGGSQYCVSFACEYLGDFVDPCHAEPYRPLVDNMMSFSRPLCRDRFTPQQCDKIKATLIHLRADHILDPAGVRPAGRGDRLRGPLLAGPVPNPATGAVAYDVVLPSAAGVKVAVFDGTGRLVGRLIDRRLTAGVHSRWWQPPQALPNGAYYLTLYAGGVQESRRFILAR